MRETSDDIRAIREMLSGRGTVTIQSSDGSGVTASKAAVRAAILEAEPSEYLTTEEAAGVLNVSRPYVVKLVDTGELPCITTQGGHRRIPREALLRYRDEMKRVRRNALMEIIAIGKEAGLYEQELEAARAGGEPK